MDRNIGAALKRPRKEGPIQKAILDYLNGLPKAKFYNMHGNVFQGSGKPDIIGCLNGRFIAIEVKRPGEKPTRIQAHELKLWGMSGAITMVATSLGEVKIQIEEVSSWFGMI